jgi:hypothetical protein
VPSDSGAVSYRPIIWSLECISMAHECRTAYIFVPHQTEPIRGDPYDRRTRDHSIAYQRSQISGIIGCLFHRGQTLAYGGAHREGTSHIPAASQAQKANGLFSVIHPVVSACLFVLPSLSPYTAVWSSTGPSPACVSSDVRPQLCPTTALAPKCGASMPCLQLCASFPH